MEGGGARAASHHERALSVITPIHATFALVLTIVLLVCLATFLIVYMHLLVSDAGKRISKVEEVPPELPPIKNGRYR